MKDTFKVGSNPFEIRTELLQIAQDYCQKQWEANTEFARASFEQMVKLNKVSHTEWAKHAPQFYKFEDIIEKAKELYGFVNSTR